MTVLPGCWFVRGVVAANQADRGTRVNMSGKMKRRHPEVRACLRASKGDGGYIALCVILRGSPKAARTSG
ncbi:MAG: hypothetical protein JZU55_00460 [Afipia sp.]|jgi:hypothetical protein|nr:hypothetical protein [Afipia sp.]MCR6733216.1 hypothetical protein [Afipia sp.]